MNAKTWTECCQLCIDNLKDNGVNYSRSKITIMKWNREFRLKDVFGSQFNKGAREPKLFQFFPESKREVIKFCLEGVKNSSLSSEALCHVINISIAPN